MSAIIQVTNLSKGYIISHEGKETYTALRDIVAKKASELLTFKKEKKVITKEEFWALKNINFEIEKGDRVGIIGRNGAGKSTLLKILSRITGPTSGNIKIKGRVAALLEVGTGFHPELTGRENIFLNGAILGMSRAEIKKHFDAIVDFAEIEKFLDTPVKRYSSGMYVRLAFAVAAHLEPEVLIIDEVLAVGDAQFQKKCLGKMEDVSKNEGRTILFVSHNMLAVENICNKAMTLQNGILIDTGKPRDLINKYYAQKKISLQYNAKINENINDSNPVFIKEANIDIGEKKEIFLGEKFKIIFTYEKKYEEDIALNLILRNFTDEVLFENPSSFISGTGIFTTIFDISPNLLNSGTYRVQINFINRNLNVLYYKTEILQFEILEQVYIEGLYFKTVGDFFPNFEAIHQKD